MQRRSAQEVGIELLRWRLGCRTEGECIGSCGARVKRWRLEEGSRRLTTIALGCAIPAKCPGDVDVPETGDQLWTKLN